MAFRTETDTMGEVPVPETALWGAQTQRALDNFRIGTEPMPPEVIRALALIKKAAAQVNHDFGLLSREKMDLISRACDEIIGHELDDHFPLKVWQTGSGTQTNMNLNEVIANRAHVLGGNTLDRGKRRIHPNDDVNRSQSSNDVFPTAMHIAAVTLIRECTLPGLNALKKGLDEKSRAWQSIVKTGRTHCMDAVPLTLGQEFSGYVSMLDHGIRALTRTIPRLLELPAGGTAVGTGLNAPSGFDVKLARALSAPTGFEFIPAANKFECLAAHDGIVQCHAALKALAVSLMKIGNDIRMLGSGPRCGIGELRLPANEPGSSIMPGKVNPTQVEALTMACAQVMGNDTVITFAAGSGHFELNVFKPVIIHNFLQSARLLGDSALSFLENCIQGLSPDEQQIRSHLNRSLMLVTALSPHLGYEAAARIAKKAYADHITLKQACLELGVMTADEFDRLVVPENMISPTASENQHHM